MPMQPDGMHSRITRELASVTQMLHYLEAAWWADQLPDDEDRSGEANIKAIFKKHKNGNLENYRPADISLWESYGASLPVRCSSYMEE